MTCGSELPSALQAHLDAASLRPLWTAVRDRLERNGHVLRGTVSVELDDDGADRISGLLARPLSAGTSRLRLAELDRALRTSSAARGLPTVVATLTGSPMRNRPAERSAARAESAELWRLVDTVLARAGLADRSWVAGWIAWLRRSGLLTRLPDAGPTLSNAVRVLTEILGVGDDSAPSRLRGELAMRCTGSSHGLDDGTPVAAPVLRAAAERRAIWAQVGVSTDEVSGTVLTWGLRPPGRDRWSSMMRERAELALVTHLTAHELRSAPELTRAGEVVYACENPQVLQSLATARIDRAVICTSGNPAAAGAMLLSRVPVRYHGDFDWSGVAIAARIFAGGAQPWLYGASDYVAAVERIQPDFRLPLDGRPVQTPWDAGLETTMTRVGSVVHEEALLDVLLADLSR